MPLLPGYQATNIMLTVQRRIGNSLLVGSETVPVLYGRWPDPDARRTTNGTPMKSYICVQWLDQTAGQKGAHVCAIDIFTRIGPETGGDPQGIRCSRIADAIQALFIAPDKDRFFVQDFADPTVPLNTNVCLFTRGAKGTRGMCYSRRVIPWEMELNRINMTYQFKTAVDLSGPTTFDPQ